MPLPTVPVAVAQDAVSETELTLKVFSPEYR